MGVSRFDNSPISLTERVGANGYLNLPAILTRAGVFSYRQADGSTIKELRHPDEVFKPASLGTLKHVPLITEQDHLRCVTDDVPVNQVSEFTSLGVVGDRLDRNDQDEVEGNVTAYRPETIKKIDTGAEAQLSAGYTTDIVSEAGTYKGEAYDQKQTNIVYGHVAVVRRGRAGSARFRVDSTAAILSTETKTKKEDSVEKTIIKKEIPAITVGTGENSFRMDSLTVEESPGVLSVLARESLLIGKCEKAHTRADRAEGERDQLKTAKEKLEAELKDAIPASRLDAEIKEGTELLKMCDDLKIKPEGGNLEKKRAICLAVNPGLDKDRLDGDYLDGVLDPIKADWESKKSQYQTKRNLLNSDQNPQMQKTTDGYENHGN